LVNTVTAQPTLLKPSLVKTTQFELERYLLTLTEMWFCRNPQMFMLKTEHFTLCVKTYDTTKSANIKIVVLQSWNIITRTCTIAVLLNMKNCSYIKC